MSSINSVNSYWGGSSANLGGPKKAGSNTASDNLDPLTKYWGRPGAGLQKAGANAASFKIQEGQLDVQATSFIQKWDANEDGVLDLNEFRQSDGLTGDVKTSISSAELAQALWAAIAGPDGTLSAAEYARGLLGMDENLDGVITQKESDKIKIKWAKEAAEDPGKANVRIYNDNVALGTDVGLDTKFALGFEEKYAKSLEEDDMSDMLDDTTSATDSSDIAAILKSLGIDMPQLATTKPANATSTTPDIAAILKSLGITSSTSTAGSDANYGFSAELLATLHDPKNIVDGLPIA
ncbi:MAG: hypothetical protein ACK551_04340 [Vampirovibrionales bacterium]